MTGFFLLVLCLVVIHHGMHLVSDFFLEILKKFMVPAYCLGVFIPHCALTFNIFMTSRPIAFYHRSQHLRSASKFSSDFAAFFPVIFSSNSCIFLGCRICRCP